MVTVIENPVITTFEEAVYKYKGYYIGMQTIDADETCIYKVKVLIYSDSVPDEEFIKAWDKLAVDRLMRANPDGMLFPTREEMEAKRERDIS